ncbi:hypothetical protein, partial [Escherichia coli]|uniref:hypothetical protein n=11 Tax=Enterobacterales TaxID=91347 RepID=UPI001FCEBCDE
PSHVAIAECILAYSSASLVSRDFARFRALHVQQLDHVFAFRSPLKRPKNRDRMCKCNTVTRDDIPFAIWSGLRPDTPHQCVRAQCGFRFSSASSPTRSLRSVAGAAASGITSRMLSVIPVLFFWG